MTRTKSNSVSELIAVAELKEITLRVEHKLDLLLSSRSYVPNVTTPTMPKDEGPKDWTEGELKAWVDGLDGLTRANIEAGASDPQEVWEAMKAEGW